jgi:mono/diheme cytochrome c family protein
MRKLIFAAATAATLASCGDGEKSHRGIELMPDMFHTPAYKRQDAMVLTKDKSADGKEHHYPAMMPPVAGTVSRDFVAYSLAPADLDGAAKQVNPLAPTTEVLRQGQHGFNIYCAVCHGRDGDAKNGYVAKHFSGVPSLTSTNVAGYADGQIYHFITTGKARMPSYAAQLPPEQRWAVVHYVRALNRAAIAVMDVEKMVQDAELSLHDNPGDANKKRELDNDRTLLEQRRHDLDAIQRVGDGAGDEFKPMPDPRPEYEAPVWPEADAHAKEGGK